MIGEILDEIYRNYLESILTIRSPEDVIPFKDFIDGLDKKDITNISLFMRGECKLYRKIRKRILKSIIHRILIPDEYSNIRKDIYDYIMNLSKG